MLVTASFATAPRAEASAESLPGGVRAFVYKHVRAKVPGTFQEEGQRKNFSVRETLGSDIIQQLGADVKNAYDELHAVAPRIAEDVNLGKIDLDPQVSAQANVFGLAWGISDHLMLGAGVPVMKADVRIGGGYFDTKSIAEAARKLRAVSDPAVKFKADALARILEQLPTLKGEHLQGVAVNQFGYKPIGHWSATGIGDAQVFAQGRVFEGDFYRNALKLGSELPTGRKDDPDNLVDIPFGKGYHAPFAESLHDFWILNGGLSLSLAGRYQRAMKTVRDFRLPASHSFPLTAEKERIRYKPGDVLSYSAELAARLWRQVGFAALYSKKWKRADRIQGARTDYNYGILEHKTSSVLETLEATISYSTVDRFLRNRFPIPFRIGATFSRALGGRNTEDVSSSSLNFEMYF